MEPQLCFRRFGSSDGGVPLRCHTQLNLNNFVMANRNEDIFLNNLCVIKSQHRPLKSNHPLVLVLLFDRKEKQNEYENEKKWKPDLHNHSLVQVLWVLICLCLLVGVLMSW